MTEVEWSSSIEAAQTYERVLVPALFQQWAHRMLEAGHVKEGDHVLDLACGTGVVAREATTWVGESGHVVGLDKDRAMLSVAQLSEPKVVWEVGDAAAMPFDDSSFDVIICQAGLMFFPDQASAVAEMRRVLRPGGSLVIHVWAQCDAQDAFADVLERHVGRKAADNYRTPWNLKDPTKLLDLIRKGGFADPRLMTEPGTATYPSMEVFLEGASGILVSVEANTQRLKHDAGAAMKDYIGPDGIVKFREPAHVVTATKN